MTYVPDHIRMPPVTEGDPAEDTHFAAFQRINANLDLVAYNLGHLGKTDIGDFAHGASAHSGNIGGESQVTFDATGGHAHTGSDSRAIDHANLDNKGTNTHAAIDAALGAAATHEAAAAPHSGHVQVAGQIGGTAGTPDIRGLRETSGPTLLAMGAVADGAVVKRAGTGLVGQAFDHTGLTNIGTNTHAAIDTALGAAATHEGAAAPHSGHEVTSAKGAASGYAGLDNATKVPAVQLGGTGADSTKYLRGDQSWAVPAAGSAAIAMCGGFLALVSATQIQWQYRHSGQILLHDGTNWQLVQVASQPTAANTATALDGSALAVNTIYDVFAEYVNGTSFNLAFCRWANSGAGTSSRNAGYSSGTAYAAGDRVTYSGHDYVCILAGTGEAPSSSPTYWCDNGASVTGDFAGLYRQDGVLVSRADSNGKKRRWLGIIFTYSNSGTVNFRDEERYRFISNYYNALQADLHTYNDYNGQWYYATTGVNRECNGGTNNQHGYGISCLTQITPLVCIGYVGSSNTGSGYVGIGLNTTSTMTLASPFGGSTSAALKYTTMAKLTVSPGYFYLVMLESATSAIYVYGFGGTEGSIYLWR